MISMKARVTLITLAVTLILAAGLSASARFDELKQGQVIGQFRTECVYQNADSAAIGGRFRHIPSGFVLDLFYIQSLPQGFFWVNSFPPSDKGEPHTCEHLVLGKGTKGRYVSSLGNMLLSESSAFTDQLRTCYHFNTAGGTDAFYTLFEEQLDALLHPTYSDEEISREVCNMGISMEQSDSSLRLEEKGTVYNEMVSGYESPWGEMSFRLGKMVFGENHPLSNESGGYPAAIRTMTPQDLRTFHDAAYHLNNMGVIVAIPSEIDMTACLNKLSAILGKVEPDAKTAGDPSKPEERLPSTSPAPGGTIVITQYPSKDPNQPGQLTFAWPATRNLDTRELYLLELLLDNMAGDQTSILYRTFVESKTRKIETGATGVSGWVSSDLGNPVYITLSNVNTEFLTERMIDSLRTMIVAEFDKVASYAEGSAELAQFNSQAKGRMAERERNLKVFLNQPPGFGIRGTGGRWLSTVSRAGNQKSFMRSLMFTPEFAYVDSVLASGGNIWREFISNWQLTAVKPYAAAAVPDTSLLERNERERRERIRLFTDQLKKKYSVASDADAIKQFKQDYDRKTNEIEQEAKSIPMPQFVSNPPLTLDDQIKYEVDKLPGGGEIVVSTFDNITSTTVGLAFDLRVVPESMLVYLPALPTVLADIGVVSGKDTISYFDMRERLRQEVLDLNAYFSVNPRTGRVELVARAAGSDAGESRNAFKWLNSILFDQNLSPSNLPRIRDAIDQSLTGTRNRMRGSAEGWVDAPAQAYWKQNDPLLLSADCFLTQENFLLRLRWLLREPSEAKVGQEFSTFMSKLGGRAQNHSRKELTELVRGIENLSDSTVASAPNDSLTLLFMVSQPETKTSLRDALSDLERTLPDIPDANLNADWSYLCRQIAADYQVPAAATLKHFKRLLGIILRQDNVRGFVVANSRGKADALANCGKVIERLGNLASVRQKYHDSPIIVERLKQREPVNGRPLFVGLINDNTRSGVFVNSANSASYLDSSNDAILNFLADRLYGGHGANSMFNKTWGAGLAYSNGLRNDPTIGRMIYYAERCPDLAQTMQFVVNELKNAPHDKLLADYAVAVGFVGSRGGIDYDQRGEQMANDLADGITPNAVRSFRKKILSLRSGDMFYEQIQNRMQTVYGLILPGYGPRAVEAVTKADANFFTIGPEAQFESYEKYLRSVEGDATLYRLYPRDFWLTTESK
jgi:Zn-dependent M16 (insulinase) family peptidase